MDSASLLARHDRRLPRYTSYPTAPLFDAGVDTETVRAWLGAIPPGIAASLYLHVPFCKSLCWFCGCSTSVVRSVGALEHYAQALQSEMARVARHAGHRLAVRQIHWGGGTPTALPAPLMQAVTSALHRHFDIDAATEIAIEIDPRTVPPADELRALGITRASLGVQDFAEEVQAAIGRHQSFEQTRAAADAAREAGARSINLDLVYGLPHQSVASLERTIEAALELAPDRIALFGYAHVPWKEKRQQVLAERALPGTEERFAQQERAAAMLVEAGYVRIGLDHFARPGDSLTQALVAGAVRRNFQGYTTDDSEVLIGLGASAISRLPQGYAQNAHATAEYLAAIDAGGLATRRGRALAGEDRLRGQIIERIMCDLAVDVGGLAAASGVGLERFDGSWPVLDRLAADGLVVRDGARLTVPEAARPFLRHVAGAFDAYLDPQALRHSAAI
ncbi:MAG: oxygen-independent coproporphyrinogen III oxidase [Rhodospirillales bacterium]|nr:oxygen-independent coproporphyrinogen III oxidase [Rhodospirillales bacterium]MDE2575441.1 oxygen-independent coproporphyrinogen III oxidase [Rhodospirillales bacterium]